MQNKHKIIATLNYALFDDLKMSGEMQLVECNNCYFTYNNTELQPNDFFRYYSKNEYYLAARSAGSGGYNPKDAKRYSRIYAKIKGILTVPEPTILDFGCGKGGMLNWLSDNTPAKLVGIEASATCRAFAEKNLSIAVFSSLLEVDRKVDVIILSHILEHVYWPGKLLEELANISHSGTVFYIEVPRAESYISSSGIHWRELYFEHINHFSEPGLNNTLTSAGLHILTKEMVYFYQDDTATSECQYCIAQKGEAPTDTNIPIAEGLPEVKALPSEKVLSEVIKEADPVSIWGISQYTQLVLGAYPELTEKVKYLFDSSPAKIGRAIRGIMIMSSSKLPLLGDKDILLIPTSPYIKEMMETLSNCGFMGRVVIF